MASTPLKSTGTGAVSHVIRELASLYGLAGSVICNTPSGKMLFQMLGVFAELEREIIRERIIAGQLRARAQGK